MTKILVSLIAAGALVAGPALAQAQSAATSADASASSGKHTTKRQRAASKKTVNEAGTSTPNSTGATAGAYTQSGSVAPTTTDPMQVKNARDGSPKKPSSPPKQ